MPILKSAVKKLRQSAKRAAQNRTVKKSLKNILDSFKKKPTAGGFAKLVSALDKAAKKNVIHANKAARMKSRLSRLLKPAALRPSIKRVRG